MPAPSALTDHLGYWLRYVSNHVSQAFARKVEAEGVTVAEWACLRELFDRSPTAPSILADALGVTRGAVSKLEDRLIAKGLAQRAPDPDDGRAHRLSLTQAGRALTPRLATLADQNDAEFFADLTPDERRGLETLLRRIVERRRLTARPID